MKYIKNINIKYKSYNKRLNKLFLSKNKKQKNYFF